MKAKTIYLLALLLCVVVACKKDVTTTPQPEPVRKYLSQIKSATPSPFNYVETCTWDAQKRLKTWKNQLTSTLKECTFYYDSLDNVSKMVCYDHEYGYGYYLFYWNYEKKNT